MLNDLFHRVPSGILYNDVIFPLSETTVFLCQDRACTRPIQRLDNKTVRLIWTRDPVVYIRIFFSTIIHVIHYSRAKVLIFYLHCVYCTHVIIKYIPKVKLFLCVVLKFGKMAPTDDEKRKNEDGPSPDRPKKRVSCILFILISVSLNIFIE